MSLIQWDQDHSTLPGMGAQEGRDLDLHRASNGGRDQTGLVRDSRYFRHHCFGNNVRIMCKRCPEHSHIRVGTCEPHLFHVAQAINRAATTVGVFGKKLDAPLMERQCMAKCANVTHPRYRLRESWSARESDR